ncbi:hypothetical protein H4W32_004483 [Actinophytocola algeriensis]|uniref:Uncharacterized protein n=1 Tax=Actinophytocola algeriensis TaxID=1768010 RepID=A0A7W7Q0F8_9PSEU|nr:hypothetical protein [Actinophytocola algeriensis]MBE1476441.1 hypothetical protein [Actinophytocola algeriensis]
MRPAMASTQCVHSMRPPDPATQSRCRSRCPIPCLGAGSPRIARLAAGAAAIRVSRDVGEPAHNLVARPAVWQHAIVTTSTVIIIAERAG